MWDNDKPNKQTPGMEKKMRLKGPWFRPVTAKQRGPGKKGKKDYN